MRRTAVALLSLLLLSLPVAEAEATVIDQTCPERTWWDGVYSIHSYSPLGQEFVPTMSIHRGVAVQLSNSIPPEPRDPITVSLHVGSIQGPLVPGSVVTREMPYDGWEIPWAEFLFQEPLNLVPGQTYVIEVDTDDSRWMIKCTGDDCYEPGSMIRNGSPRSTDLKFRTLCNAAPSSIASLLYCYPTWGQIPLTSNFSLRLSHDHEGETRTIAGHIDITLGNGQFVPNFRAGYTNVHYGPPRVVLWWLNLPAIYPLLGTNLFEFVAEDVTAAPYNQPPYAPSGDTDSDFCEIWILGGED